MKKLLIATILGGVIGFTASAATRSQGVKGSIACGPITCSSHEECCVSPAPISYRCVKPGSCPYNN